MSQPDKLTVASMVMGGVAMCKGVIWRMGMIIQTQGVNQGRCRSWEWLVMHDYQ